MENKKKIIPWIIIVVLLIVISGILIWYFNKPKTLEVIEDYPQVEGSIGIEEIICKI